MKRSVGFAMVLALIISGCTQTDTYQKESQNQDVANTDIKKEEKIEAKKELKKTEKVSDKQMEKESKKVMESMTKEETNEIVLNSHEDKVSYAIGLDIGENFQKQGMPIEVNILAKGIKDAMTDATALMTTEEIQETMTALRKEMMEKQQAKMQALGEANKQAGERFLAENKTKEGVVVLPSGLQYKVIEEGAGDTPTAADTVTTHYRGTLIDGTEFDSSYRRGTPASFPVTGVIKGWTEALQLMKVGAKWQLFIPSDLAYGSRGAGQKIGPNSTLIFDIELLDIKKK